MADIPLTNIAGAGSATTGIFNSFTVAGYTAQTIDTKVTSGAIATFSGALTANTLSTVLNSPSSGGIISHLSIRTVDTTSRTLRVKITNETGVLCDTTSAAITLTDNGCVLAGFARTSLLQLPPIQSLGNFKVEIASSLSETDKFIIEIAYQTRRG